MSQPPANAAPTSPPGPAPLRVLALLTDAYGGRGGIAKFNRDLLGALAACPAVGRVTTVVRHIVEAPGPIPAGIDWRPDGAAGKLAFVRTALAASRAGIGAVLCGHINLLPLARLVAALRGARLLLVVHGIDAWQPPASLRNPPLVPVARWLLAGVDDIIAVSEVTAERLARWSRIRRERVRVLPNCVDLARFSPAVDTRHLRARLGLDGCRVLLTVGRLAGRDRHKGFDEVLEVLQELRQEYPDLRYVIGGDGPDRARLEARAVALGVADIVHFLGYVPEDDKAALYTLADAYVMPSRGEGFGIVFLEALASGVPAIGSRVDGSREALRDGLLGALVDPDDPDELRTAIRAALARPRGVPPGLDYFGDAAFRARVCAIVRREPYPAC